MARTLEQLDADLTQAQADIAALGGKSVASVAFYTPSGDPRWFTPMSDAEKAAFTASGLKNDTYGGGGEEAMQRARFGWKGGNTTVSPDKTAAAFVENKRIADMTPNEYAASRYASISHELACYLNLTDCTDNPSNAVTVEGWIAWNGNSGAQGGPSGPRQ
jgi:hypothetical protein